MAHFSLFPHSHHRMRTIYWQKIQGACSLWNLAFESSSCLVFIQAFHGVSAQVQNRTNCQTTSSSQQMRILCHACAPGRQCWLSQQVAPPVWVSASNSLAPREASGITLSHRGTCCVLGLPWGKRLHVCNCTVLMGAAFSHTHGILSHTFTVL